MPVAKGTSSRGALLAGIAAVFVAALIIAGVLLASRGGDSVEITLGDKDFRNISATNLAEEIGENGPVPFSDLLGTNRAVWVNHLGSTAEKGWVAFFARVPETPECIVEWNRDTEVFFNTCDESQTYPRDGEGLELIPTKVVNGNLIIDINNRGFDDVDETEDETTDNE